eukprot:GFYU01043147.1.p1 GENE.GFYU01043147.1~~GFYU01043147.1.p1  ORF type:complete len:158 (-),score=30.23 GFYU01043147.1:220-693(-)
MGCGSSASANAATASATTNDGGIPVTRYVVDDETGEMKLDTHAHERTAEEHKNFEEARKAHYSKTRQKEIKAALTSRRFESGDDDDPRHEVMAEANRQLAREQEAKRIQAATEEGERIPGRASHRAKREPPQLKAKPKERASVVQFDQSSYAGEHGE